MRVTISEGRWCMRGLLTALAISLLIQPMQATAKVRDKGRDTIESSSRTFVVSYPGGTTETILVEYTALVDYTMWQTGSSAKPLEGKFTDDRACHWKVNSYVTRTPSFVSQSGLHAPIGPTIKVFESEYTRKRGADSKIEEIFYHTTCGDQRASYDREVASARQSGRDKFREVVTSDAKDLAEDLKKHLKAVSVDPK